MLRTCVRILYGTRAEFRLDFLVRSFAFLSFIFSPSLLVSVKFLVILLLALQSLSN